MGYFEINDQKGNRKKFSATTKTISESVTEVSIGEQPDYSQVEFIDYIVNEQPIKAGEKGFFILPAGSNKGLCKDYGLGHYKERPDGEYEIKDTFMPLYGMKYREHCLAVIVTGMRGDESWVLEIKEGAYTFKIRFYVRKMEPYEMIRLECHEIVKEDASWCEIAKVYRNYQLSHGYRTLRERMNPKLKYSIEAPNIRIRMAWKPVPCEIYEQTEENEPSVHVACTFDEVIRLMEGYQKAGIEKAEFCLVGWNKKGHDGRWPQILPVESSIGGEEGLKRVIAKAKELGYAMTCHTNSTDAYSIADNFNIADIAMRPNGEKSVQSIHWSGGRTYNLCPKRAYEISMQTLPEVAKLGFSGMHYIDVITCTPPRECFDPAHPLTKKEGSKYFDRLFEKTKEMFGAVGSEGAYDHALKNCDFTLYVSFADFTSEEKRYVLSDMDIPFWQIVYHGIVTSNPYSRTVNATASDDPRDLLKVIEFGGKPEIYYYARFVNDGTNWLGKGDFRCNTEEEITYSASMCKKTVDIYNELSYLQYEFMEDHREIALGVFEVSYSDGSVITVDYNKNTYSLSRN